MAALRKPAPWPRGEDLPDGDGVPMESEEHPDLTRIYLIRPLRRWCKENRFTAFIGGNSFVRYDPRRPRNPVGPDVYVVNGGVYRGQSQWVVWEEEGRMPTLIIELNSPTTEHVDQGTKKSIYQSELRCPDYFMFNDVTGHFEGYRLEGGQYVAVPPLEDGSIPCSTLPLRLAVRNGKLRWILPDGSVLPSNEELASERAETERKRADAEHQRAENEHQRVETERRRADRAEQRVRELEENLRRLGSDPS